MATWSYDGLQTHSISHGKEWSTKSVCERESARRIKKKNWRGNLYFVICLHFSHLTLTKWPPHARCGKFQVKNYFTVLATTRTLLQSNKNYVEHKGIKPTWKRCDVCTCSCRWRCSHISDLSWFVHYNIGVIYDWGAGLHVNWCGWRCPGKWRVTRGGDRRAWNTKFLFL